MAESSPQAGQDADDDKMFIFKAEVQDGRCFGPDVQAVVCAATFAGVTKLTPYSVGRGDHVWNVTLAWRVSQQQLRQFQAQGQKDCKVVCSNKEGVKLGWFMLDVRTAKLQHQYKKDDGRTCTPLLLFLSVILAFVPTGQSALCCVHVPLTESLAQVKLNKHSL